MRTHNRGLKVLSFDGVPDLPNKVGNPHRTCQVLGKTNLGISAGQSYVTLLLVEASGGSRTGSRDALDPTRPAVL